MGANAGKSTTDTETDDQDFKRITLRIRKRAHLRLWAAKILRGENIEQLAERGTTSSSRS